MFIGNLSFETTKDELQQLATEYGTITDVFLPTDRATGRPRGFGFVEFESEDAANSAIQGLDGREHRGRNLRVNRAEDRPRRSPSFGGGGGGSMDPPPDFARKFKNKGSRRNIRGRKRSL